MSNPTEGRQGQPEGTTPPIDSPNGGFGIRATALRWCLPHVAKDPRRPALAALHLEANGLLVATDGSTLAVYRDAHNSLETRSLVLDSRDTLRALGRGRKASDTLLVYPVEGSDDALCGVASSPDRFAGRFTDPTDYPNWRVVLRLDDPPTYPRDIFAIDLKLLARFEKGLDKPKGTPARLVIYAASHNLGAAGIGNRKPQRDALVVRPSGELPDGYGLIMPMQLEGPFGPVPDIFPDWLPTG